MDGYEIDHHRTWQAGEALRAGVLGLVGSAWPICRPVVLPGNDAGAGAALAAFASTVERSTEALADAAWVEGTRTRLVAEAVFRADAWGGW